MKKLYKFGIELESPIDNIEGASLLSKTKESPVQTAHLQVTTCATRIYNALIRWRNSAVFRGSVLKINPTLKGKTVVITEPFFAKKYTGYYAAKEFASRGAKVYVLAPQPVSICEEKADIIKKETGNEDVYVCPVDLSSLRSIRLFGNSFREKSMTVDYLINNADLYKPPRVPTDEGYPRRFAVNYLGRALLTQYLLECLNRSPNGKILNVNQMCFSSNSQTVQEAQKERGDMDYLLGHPENFNSLPELEVYSYLLYNANRKFVTEMAKKLQGTNTTINQVEMEMNRSHIMGLRLESWLYEELFLFYRHTNASGGKLIAYAALSEEFDGKSGVVINGSETVESVRLDDSGTFFRHTSEVLETFEELFPLRQAIETEKVQSAA